MTVLSTLNLPLRNFRVPKQLHKPNSSKAMPFPTILAWKSRSERGMDQMLKGNE